ncbi:acyl-CoA Delta(11) desaturase-like [Bradysia coprophila]|uniref:acyl-CoA Delta(11) desaturase-like n=1 Tax=Bradysia coprophila TaxID=38358 RepID=UPI00187DB873|nr:acyl-CoA Delta(11) desaturase-like [Bradysia coprophila]
MPLTGGTETKYVDDRSTSPGRQQQLKIPRDYPNANPYDTKPGEKPYKLEILWRYVFLFAYLHIACVIALFLPITGWQFFIGFLYGFISSFGTTAGAHRYWAHKCYKATRPLYFILLFLQTVFVQDCVIRWVRNHRIHHKYPDTNADPHNASRGFFFSHIGWLMCKRHPDVIKYGRRVDISDLTSDPVLRFQKKYYFPLALFGVFLLPMFLATYFLEMTFWTAYHWNIFRYMFALNLTFCVNSVSHIWGSKPFEKDITSTDTYAIGFLTIGEGWHNYHHVYPFDYKCSELSRYWCNPTIFFIDFFAWLGWAYDLKTVPDEMVRRRVLRTGDGSNRHSKEIKMKHKTSKQLVETCTEKYNDEEEERRDRYWGWGDDDMLQEDINDTKIIKPKNK